MIIPLAKRTILVNVFIAASTFAADLADPVINSVRAESLAIAYTSFNVVPFSSLDTVRNDRTPFFHERFVDRAVWHIEFKDVSLTADDMLRTYHVYVDSTDGSLLKIEAPFAGQDSLILPDRSADVVEQRMKNAGEVYSLPSGPPDIPLGVILKDSLWPVLQKAKAITALYVMWADSRKAAVPAWIITFRGIPPRPVHGRQDIPIWQRNRFRYVVDARSGKTLAVMNYPRSEEPNLAD